MDGCLAGLDMTLQARDQIIFVSANHLIRIGTMRVPLRAVVVRLHVGLLWLSRDGSRKAVETNGAEKLNRTTSDCGKD